MLMVVGMGLVGLQWLILVVCEVIVVVEVLVGGSCYFQQFFDFVGECFVLGVDMLVLLVWIEVYIGCCVVVLVFGDLLFYGIGIWLIVYFGWE